MFQSFLDGLAHAAGKDPLQFCLELLGNAPPKGTQGVMDAQRMIDVVKLVAKKSSWDKQKFPESRAMGIAFYYPITGFSFRRRFMGWTKPPAQETLSITKRDLPRELPDCFSASDHRSPNTDFGSGEEYFFLQRSIAQRSIHTVAFGPAG